MAKYESTPPKYKSAKLGPKDLEVIKSVARLRFATLPQLVALHWPNNESYTVATRRVNQLCQHGFLHPDWLFPETNNGFYKGHPIKLLMWPEDKRDNLKEYLDSKGQFTLWQQHKFDELTQTYNHGMKFANDTKQHEKFLTDFLLAVEASCAKPGSGVELVFWERCQKHGTKNFSKQFDVQIEIPRMVNGQATKVSVTRTYDFNPDALVCFREVARDHSYQFCLIELANKSTPEQHGQHMAAHVQYHRQGYFLNELLPHLINYYGLDIPKPVNAFRTLTVTPDDHRRNLHLAEALKLNSLKLLNFGSLTDITPDNFFDSVWVRGYEYKSLAIKEKSATEGWGPVRRNKWRDEQLQQLTKISLLD